MGPERVARLPSLGEVRRLQWSRTAAAGRPLQRPMAATAGRPGRRERASRPGRREGVSKTALRRGLAAHGRGARSGLCQNQGWWAHGGERHILGESSAILRTDEGPLLSLQHDGLDVASVASREALHPVPPFLVLGDCFGRHLRHPTSNQFPSRPSPLPFEVRASLAGFWALRVKRQAEQLVECLLLLRRHFAVACAAHVRPGHGDGSHFRDARQD
mmetsp:Transcript_35517/g.75620  ORF Transcript_35517/g.75620 Transcript_35517/m.75620 type:complete len:216 (-) Transcript_35517:499-1146(-)